MRRRRVERVGLALALAGGAIAAAPATGGSRVALGPVRRLTTPGSTMCPAESEPEIAVTKAGTWVGYNDLGGCSAVFPAHITSVQLLPAGGGAPRLVKMSMVEPDDLLFGDPDLAPSPRGDGSVLFSSMYFEVGAGVVREAVATISPSGAVTWLPMPDPDGTSADKPFIATDTGARSKFRGRIYATWDTLGKVVLTSFDGRGWSALTEVAPRVGYPDVAVSPTGEVAVAVETIGGIHVVTSRDGGRTFGDPELALAGESPGYVNPSCPLRPTVGPRQRAIRGPHAAYDRRGWLHVTASLGQLVAVGTLGNSTVRHAISKDGGRTFAELAVAPELTATFNAAIAPLAGGGVAVSYLALADDPGISFDTWLSVLPEGARAFDAPVKLSERPATFPPAQEAMGNANCYGIGDYIGLATTRTGVVAVWPTTDGTTNLLDTDLFVREAVIR